MINIQENTTAKVFKVNNNGEYGTFILMYQENYLEVICHTSFGTYAHTWNYPGENPYQFLLSMTYNSFIYKMTQGKQYVLDNEKQAIIMKELLQQFKFSEDFNDDDIAYFEELIDDITCCGTISEEEFKLKIINSELYEDLYENEYENIKTIHKVDEQIHGLWNELWIPLIENLKKINKN